MAKERILVVVKTYPTLSRKYGELVCTAGIREDGSWVRIHPVPFERLGAKQQYSKFDWIELELIQSPRRKDKRPETYAPANLEEIRVIGHVGTEDNWRERRRLLLQTPKANVYDAIQPLVDGAKANTMSLAVFKPKRIHKFSWQASEREWDAAKVAVIQNNAAQGHLFDSEHWRQTFKLIPKLPYDFSYQFTDADGKKPKMRVLDWDLGEFYWKSLKERDNMESFACSNVHKRYFEEFRRTDLHFVLGTVHRFHTWVIVGVLPFPSES